MTQPATKPAETERAAPRRRLLGLLLGSSVAASLASIFYPILKFVLPPETGELDADTAVAARADELARNTGKIFRFGSRPALLVRLHDGTYRSFSATCTHLNCTVQFRAQEQDIWCACHNGIYDLRGRNVSGPPPRPLEDYDVHVRGEEIVVTRRQKT